ncbi:hypothetical protein FBU31_003113 [Coemansia sp. 'formosensis']|nr:hypothetical protein FBU31_003113 [Coemansia sp. 'formosensis']
MFFLAAFASRSAMRLRNLQPVQLRKQRRTDMVFSCSTLAASLALSFLPAIMATAEHDDDLGVCWFARGAMSLRWVWVTLNVWVVLSLLFLIATSIYVGVILSNERRDLMSFMHPSAAAHQAGGMEYVKTAESVQLPSFYRSSVLAARHSQIAAGAAMANYHSRNYAMAADIPASIPNSLAFGARSTPRASRESLGLLRGNEAPSSDKGSKSRPAPLLIYPANHPVALAHEALHGRRAMTSRDMQHSGRTSSSGGERNSTCESCASHGSRHSERSLRHHSEIISAARYYSLSRQQWGAHCRPLSSGLVYISGLANDSESSRLSAAHPWDSSRRLIHKPSLASTAPHTRGASPLAMEHRPLYGFYAQRPVAPPPLLPGQQKGRRMAKHMSMPVASGAIGRHATSPVEPEYNDQGAAAYMATRHARQLSMPPAAASQKKKKQSRHSGATFAHGSQHPSANAEQTPAPEPLPKALQALDGTAKPSIHVNLPGKPLPNAAAPTQRAQQGLFLGALFGHRGKRRETQGQIQRIERRVHMLVATGALRVATRAMVPLVTQLCMVVWSTMHALNAPSGVLTKVYIAAILLLSTQGLLDMALYHIFDTQADNSDVSLPSYNNGSTSGSGGGKAATSFVPQQYPQSSFIYAENTPRASQDGQQQPSSHWHDAYYRQQQPPLAMRVSAEGKRRAMAAHHGRRPGHQRSISLTSAAGGGRQFVFNVDSLNIRRADRTSNAMQSDTLHDGSDCVAWSHMDALSAHDASSISQFSATAAAPHAQHHPVLSGWEEAEESPRSSSSPLEEC